MAADDNYAQHVGVCLVSLFENNKDLRFTVFVFGHAISLENKRKIMKVANKYSQKVELMDLSIDDFKGFPMTSYYSPVTYFRLRLGELLPESIHKILYLDCDTIVCGSIKDLVEYNLGGNVIAAVLDSPWQQNYSERNFGISADKGGYFNAGMMLIDLDAYRKENVYQKSCSIISSRRKLDFLDQDMLNIIFEGRWVHLHPRWNLLNAFLKKVYHDGSTIALDMEEGIISRSIIHFSLDEKPWNWRCPNPLKREYYKYLWKSPWRTFYPKMTFRQMGSLVKGVVLTYLGRRESQYVRVARIN